MTMKPAHALLALGLVLLGSFAAVEGQPLKMPHVEVLGPLLP